MDVTWHEEFHAPTLFLCLALLRRRRTRADREKERGWDGRTGIYVGFQRDGQIEILLKRSWLLEYLQKDRGYALTFGGTYGSMLGRRGWFDAL